MYYQKYSTPDNRGEVIKQNNSDADKQTAFCVFHLFWYKMKIHDAQQTIRVVTVCPSVTTTPKVKYRTGSGINGIGNFLKPNGSWYNVMYILYIIIFKNNKAVHEFIRLRPATNDYQRESRYRICCFDGVTLLPILLAIH